MHAEAVTQAGGDLRESFARTQRGRADEMGPEVPVSEREPGVAAEASDAVHRMEGLVDEAPATHRIGQPRERVHHGVEVGRDREAEVLEVVSRVHDGRERAFGEDGREPVEEARAADASGEGDHTALRLPVAAHA